MLLKLLTYDIRFQYRHGFYFVYGLVSLIYLLVLFNIPSAARGVVTAYLVMSDTSILGLTFVGALVLLEKQQNVLQSLFVTPLKLSSYLGSKTLSLAILSLLATAAIAFIPGGLLHNWLLTLVGVILCCTFFTLIGLGVAAKSNTLNQYIMGTVIYGMGLSAPVALFFVAEKLSLIFPINAGLKLILQTDYNEPFLLVEALVSLIVWNVLAYLFAKKQFEKHILSL